jgi:cysteine synthase
MAGEDQICQEYTMCQYMGDSAKEFIALELILDWNREGDLAKKSPVLAVETGRVGISNKAHKQTKNLIQILYIQAQINKMD